MPVDVNEELPVLHPYNLRAVRHTQARISDKLSIFTGKELMASVALDFISAVRAIFPTIPEPALMSSVADVIGSPFTTDKLTCLTRRLAGNIRKLKAGHPALPWTGQHEREWMLAGIIKALPVTGHNGVAGLDYDFRILAGSAAGMTVTRFMSNKQARFISSRVGFPRFRSRKKLMPYRHGRELVRMLVYVLVDPAMCFEKPGFFHISCTGGLIKQNQKILARRSRVTPCPLGYTYDELPCHRCHVGYDKCYASVHAHAWQAKPCPRCKQAGWFDIENNQVVCMSCMQKGG